MNDEIEKMLPRKPIDDILDSLNAGQLAPATAEGARIRTMAGPGTGKTKTLEARVAFLLENGVRPEEILSLSFTNESSKEFASRIQDTCGYAGFKVHTGTMHAQSNKILKKFNAVDFFKDKLGYEKGFFIIDDDDSKKLMDESIKNLPDKLHLAFKALDLTRSKISSRLSLVRSKGANSTIFFKNTVKKHGEEALKSFKGFRNSVDKGHLKDEAIVEFQSENPWLEDFLIATVFNDYSVRCRSVHGMDFDDVLLNTYYLLKFNPSIASKIAKQYKHLLVDEYQDTNPIQAMILFELLQNNKDLSLFIVGDTRQAIYDFRGSDVSLMTRAEKWFGKFLDFELTENYRSSPEMISFTNMFAKDMHNQLTPGQLTSGCPQNFASNTQCPVELHSFANDIDESKWVCQNIKRLLEHGVTPEEIFVLYRTRTAAKAIENELARNHVQFQMIGEKNFYERAEVRDTVAFLRSFVRPNDILGWARIVDCTKAGITGVTLRKKHKEEMISPRQLVESRKNKKNCVRIDSLLSFHESWSRLFKATDNEWLLDFKTEEYPDTAFNIVKHNVETLTEWKEYYSFWKREQLVDLTDNFVESFFEMCLQHYTFLDTQNVKRSSDLDIDDLLQARKERIAIVMNEVMERLLAGQSLFDIVDDVISRDSPQRDEAKATIKMMTGHASKGLEAEHVFLVGADSLIWENNKNEDSDDSRSEIERIYYVMATRAKNNMYFTQAKNRTIHGERKPSKAFPMIMNHLRKGGEQNLVKAFNHFNSIPQIEPQNRNATPESSGSFEQRLMSVAKVTQSSSTGDKDYKMKEIDMK
ncbi:DNA helicase (plasmid) [Vibrio nigripulchritudo]|uniref:ATP-dependent helicase n=1 Tax=Vibrio nigripulchritudo TaxID=28173 RepID=UPI00190A85F4|nr:ATP-dependent helicase [Vibrio nigripulchritudo]BCL74079.1 DNA helicase [Vibrio nigripulchritudo]BDU35454.1 DNA helicase [Vibrio nigripulchritudo]